MAYRKIGELHLKHNEKIGKYLDGYLQTRANGRKSRIKIVLNRDRTGENPPDYVVYRDRSRKPKPAP